MISKDIKLMKMIVESKGKITNKTPVNKTPYRFNIMYVADGSIPGNTVKIIKMKRTDKCIGVYYQTKNTD